MAWPSGTQQEDVWTVQEGLDVTPSIATSEIPVVDAYTGPNNNRWGDISQLWYSDPVAYSDSPSALPELTVTSSTVDSYTSTATIDFRSFNGYVLRLLGSQMYVKTGPNVGDSVGPLSTIAYYPATATIYATYPGKIETIPVTPDTEIRVYGTPYDPVGVIRSEGDKGTRYVDMSQGFELNTVSPQDWGNSMANERVVFWLKSSDLGSFELESRIHGGAYSPFATVANVGGTITVNGSTLGTETAYPFIQIDVGIGKTIVSGVVGAEDFLSAAYTLGNSIAIDDGPEERFTWLEMAGAAVYEVKSAQAVIGMSKGITDATITPYSYYPHNAWQVSLGQPAAFGDAIVIGSTSYPVANGSIEVGGESVRIRDMAILSLVFEEDDGVHQYQVQKVYVNGIEVWSGTPDPTFSVELAGDWYVTVTVSDVEQGKQTTYTWSMPNWGLSKDGYCLAGMMAAVTMMVVAGLYGRRDPAKAAVVLIVGGIMAAAYYMMM